MAQHGAAGSLPTRTVGGTSRLNSLPNCFHHKGPLRAFALWQQSKNFLPLHILKTPVAAKTTLKVISACQSNFGGVFAASHPQGTRSGNDPPQSDFGELKNTFEGVFKSCPGLPVLLVSVFGPFTTPLSRPCPVLGHAACPFSTALSGYVFAWL